MKYCLIEKNCDSCKNIENNNQQGGGNKNIIDIIIDNYKKKYEYYKTCLIL